MDRYKKCSIKLNKELVKRHVLFKFGSIKNYCEFAEISRVRFWQIVNKPHLTKEEKCLQTLASNLEISIDKIIL